MTNCSSYTHWRHQRQAGQLDQALADCEVQRHARQLATWVATIQCGNDNVRQQLLSSGTFRYRDLYEVAFRARLDVAQRMDAGTLSPDEGQRHLYAIAQQMCALPGSLNTLLSGTEGNRTGEEKLLSPQASNGLSP
jgi:hypothetical protein